MLGRYMGCARSLGAAAARVDSCAGVVAPAAVRGLRSTTSGGGLGLRHHAERVAGGAPGEPDGGVGRTGGLGNIRVRCSRACRRRSIPSTGRSSPGHTCPADRRSGCRRTGGTRTSARPRRCPRSPRRRSPGPRGRRSRVALNGVRNPCRSKTRFNPDQLFSAHCCLLSACATVAGWCVGPIAERSALPSTGPRSSQPG